jgi:hypothetical protein
MHKSDLTVDELIHLIEEEFIGIWKFKTINEGPDIPQSILR